MLFIFCWRVVISLIFSLEWRRSTMMMMIILTMLMMMTIIMICANLYLWIYSQAAMNRELASVDRWLNLHTSSYNLVREIGKKDIFLYLRICRWWSDVRYVHILFLLSLDSSYITHIKENMTFRTFYLSALFLKSSNVILFLF